jgi:hypothetical protein
MSKQSFVQFVENAIAQGNAPAEVVEYFEKTIKAKKINKKEQEKSETVKSAIVAFLQENAGQTFDRVEIGDALYNRAEFAEEFLLNEKGTVAYNSITAFANQLVNDNQITKLEVKVGKATKVKYGCVA